MRVCLSDSARFSVRHSSPLATPLAPQGSVSAAEALMARWVRMSAGPCRPGLWKLASSGWLSDPHIPARIVVLYLEAWLPFF